MNNPCYKCSDRQIGCHIECGRRAAWLEAHLEEKRRIYAAKEKDRLINDHVMAEKERKRRRIARKG